MGVRHGIRLPAFLRSAGLLWITTIAVAAGVAFLSGAAGAAPASAITYGYDELGRLVAVSDPANGAAKYGYDAAGNVTSIIRQAVTVVSIASFGPKIGPAGTTVTIYGTGFSATASQDTVKFNGTTASVSSASATQLVASVPAGATTGTISVTAPGGSATSSGSYAVAAPPSISGFSPGITKEGETSTLTISGSGFDLTKENDVVLLSGVRAPVTAASATSLTTTIPAPTSGKITVVTPNGKAVSSTDLVALPGQYASSDLDTNVRMNMGASQTISTAANKVSVVLFDVTGGQSVTVNLSDVTASGGAADSGVTYTLFSPSGGAVSGTTEFGFHGWLIDPIRAPQTGTYTLLLDPDAANSGNVTVTLYNAPADVTGTFAAGSPATVSIGTPGQNASYTFGGTVGDRVSLGVDNVNMSGYGLSSGAGVVYSIINPDGTFLASFLQFGFQGTFFDTTTLTQTGTYTVSLNPSRAVTGSFQLSLYNVPPDVSGTITIGGPPVDGSTTTPGQNANYTFAGTSGKNINLMISNVGFNGGPLSSVYVTIYGSSNNIIVGPTQFGFTGTTVSATLPADDTYRIALDPVGAATISYRLTLTDPPSPALHGLKQTDQQAAKAPPPALRLGVTGGKAAPSPGPEDWTPDAKNRNGDWRSHRGRSAWEHWAALQGPNGVTALAGQTLTLNGQPLADVNVKLEGGDAAAKTDETGRFLLYSAAAGHRVLIVDGTTAGTTGRPYGSYEIGVDLATGRTTAIADTIWMTRLDKGHEVTIDSPTSKEVVVTTPQIPGLELHLQPGTTIKDHDGKAVTTVSITPVPVDRPPFPLPFGVTVPLYFTIQPGGAYLSKPAELIYPNYTNLPAGQRVPFWNYDPDKKGWYIYGRGTVSPDAKQVVPDDDTRIWAFTGAMISGSLIPPLSWPHFGKLFGDPVDPSSGLFAYNKTDLVEPGPAPIALTRSYRQADSNSYSFGIGMTMPYDLRLWSTNNYQSAELILPDGARVHYQRISPGTDFTDAVYEAQTTPTPFLHSTLAWNLSASGWSLTRTDGTVYSFGDLAPLQSIRDRFGNTISLTRASGITGDITRITSSSGRWIKLTYDGSHRVMQATDSAARTVGYTYYPTGELKTVTDAKGGVTTYTYFPGHEMQTIKDPRNIVYLTLAYDGSDRVQTQTQADTPATSYRFAYSTNGNGDQQTDITDPMNNVQRVIFNADGYAKTEIDAVGTTIQQTTTFERQSGTDLLTATVDPRTRRTELGYDPRGNLTSVTRLAGTGNPVTTTFTYETKFNQLKTVKDPLNHTTTYDYNSSGALISITDPLTHPTTFVPDASGLPTQIKDALNNATTYGYLAGDLVSITDPLGSTTSRFVDNAGRVAALTDPTGNRTSYLYDALNAVTKITDAKGGPTSFVYDANDNLTSVTDPDGVSHVTAYTYDNLDRLATRKDALLHQESYAYDGNGNLTRFTDRKSPAQVTTYKYDALNRRSMVGFGTTGTPPNEVYNTRIDYTYDDGNRLLIAADSANGGTQITDVPDDLDRLLSETTPQGTVSYTYDNADRRLTMDVPGQSQVVYGYDDADRLSSLTRGSSSVAIGYDDADRRTSVTLPDGIAEQYGYDNASELTGITYKLGAATLGDLNYGYDSAGKRNAVWGTYARTGPPTAVTSATTYNVANQLTKWANKATANDLNGSLTNDSLGTTYTWNNRGQLASTSKTGTSVGYAYDAFGRRKSETVNGTTTSFLYDGPNVVQEQSASFVNLLTGLGTDETFSRTIGSDQKSLLRDALGSTVALADASGAVTTSYTYEPFGKATSSGAASTNSFQYTGRESDANGLTELRARYYSPTLQRSLSEDPIGLAGGQANLYAYVSNSPMNLVDPSGLCGLSVGGLLNSAIGRCGALNAIMFWSTFAPWGPELRLLEEAVLELRAAEAGGGFLSRLGVRLADETGALGRYGNLGKLADRADEKVADVIRSRGGGASQVNQLQTGYGELTLGELSDLAAQGDREAVKAIKMAKQAGSRGKGGR